MKIFQIGFTGDRFFNENLKNEIELRGHSVDFCSATELSVDISSDKVDIRAAGFDLEDYDLIHAGSLRRNRWPLISAFGYLGRKNGCVIVDNRLIEATLDEYSGLTRYFIEHENKINLPRSIVFKKMEEIEDRLDQFEFPVVIKMNRSRMGVGVGLAYNVNEIANFVKKWLAEFENIGFILREFIPNDGDFRVNVIDGKAVACLKRTPQKGEFRSNISLGGKMTNTKLEDAEEVCEIAEKITRLLRYDIAGVDVMVHKESGQPYILEVNRAPDLNGDSEVSGVNHAKIIVDLYEKRFVEKK